MSIKTHQQPVQADVIDTDELDTEYAPPIPIQRKSRNTAPPSTPSPARTASPDTEPERERRRFLGSRPMWLMLVGVLIVIALMLVINRVVIPAIGWSQDQWHYGDTRITQMDANVGHGGESHFLATYSQGTIVILEISLDHPNVYQVYTLTGMESTSGTPVILLSIADVNHDGKLDLIVHTEGGDMSWVLFNTGKAFSLSEGQP
jgi:hypothetical protein